MKQADAVGQAGLDVEVDERGPAGGAGIGFGHAHDHALLNREHVLQVRKVLEGIEQRTFTGAGVAEYVLDTLRPQHLHYRLFAC